MAENSNILLNTVSNKLDDLSCKLDYFTDKLDKLENKSIEFDKEILRHNIILSDTEKMNKSKFDKQLIYLAGGISLFNSLLLVVLEIVFKWIK